MGLCQTVQKKGDVREQSFPERAGQKIAPKNKIQSESSTFDCKKSRNASRFSSFRHRRRATLSQIEKIGHTFQVLLNGSGVFSQLESRWTDDGMTTMGPPRLESATRAVGWPKGRPIQDPRLRCRNGAYSEFGRRITTSMTVDNNRPKIPPPTIKDEPSRKIRLASGYRKPVGWTRR